MSELPKEHTEVQQCSGEQRGTEHWVCLAARYCQVCPQCRILYMFMSLNETKNWTSQMSLDDYNLVMCCRVKQGKNSGVRVKQGRNSGVRIFWVQNMKWFVGICTRFQWHPGCIQRNMQKNPSPWSHSVVLLLLQVFEDLIFLSFSSSLHLFTILSLWRTCSWRNTAWGTVHQNMNNSASLQQVDQNNPEFPTKTWLAALFLFLLVEWKSKENCDSKQVHVDVYLHLFLNRY